MSPGLFINLDREVRGLVNLEASSSNVHPRAENWSNHITYMVNLHPSFLDTQIWMVGRPC